MRVLGIVALGAAPVAYAASRQEIATRLAALCYRFVEMPGIAAGRKISAALSRSRDRGPPMGTAPT
jgi:hypothetical protein